MIIYIIIKLDSRLANSHFIVNIIVYVLRCEGSLPSQVISVVKVPRGMEIIRHKNVSNVGSLDWLLFLCKQMVFKFHKHF